MQQAEIYRIKVPGFFIIVFLICVQLLLKRVIKKWVINGETAGRIKAAHVL